MKPWPQAAFVSAAAVFLAVGCRDGSAAPPSSNAVPVPKPLPAWFDPSHSERLMPLDKGDTWNFDATLSRTTATAISEPQSLPFTYTITEVKREPRRITATFEFRNGDTLMERHRWLETPEGIFQLDAGKGTKFEPAQLIVPFPATGHRKFEWSGTGPKPVGGAGRWKIDGEVEAPEPVDTDEGPMMAIPVTQTSSFGAITSSSTTWFRPDIGMVRFWQEIDGKNGSQVVTMVLHNHELKQ